MWAATAPATRACTPASAAASTMSRASFAAPSTGKAGGNSPRIIAPPFHVRVLHIERATFDRVEEALWVEAETLRKSDGLSGCAGQREHPAVDDELQAGPLPRRPQPQRP